MSPSLLLRWWRSPALYWHASPVNHRLYGPWLWPSASRASRSSCGFTSVALVLRSRNPLAQSSTGPSVSAAIIAAAHVDVREPYSGLLDLGGSMTTRTRRSLQVAVMALGVFFFVGNLAIDGTSLWDFIPLLATVGGLFAIEQVRRNQERGL